MIRELFLMAALIGLLPAHMRLGNDSTALSPPKVPEALKQEWLQMVEGSLTEVNPERLLIQIESLQGEQMEFRYNERTQVEGAEEAVVGCFGPKYERRARVYFRTVDGSKMAVRIELLANRIGMDSD